MTSGSALLLSLQHARPGHTRARRVSSQQRRVILSRAMSRTSRTRTRGVRSVETGKRGQGREKQAREKQAETARKVTCQMRRAKEKRVWVGGGAHAPADHFAGAFEHAARESGHALARARASASSTLGHLARLWLRVDLWEERVDERVAVDEAVRAHV
eukprot:3706734-Pleurochrysis_carterae.AAC.1